MLPTSTAILYFAIGLPGSGRIRCSSWMRVSGFDIAISPERPFVYLDGARAPLTLLSRTETAGQGYQTENEQTDSRNSSCRSGGLTSRAATYEKVVLPAMNPQLDRGEPGSRD